MLASLGVNGERRRRPSPGELVSLAVMVSAELAAPSGEVLRSTIAEVVGGGPGGGV